MIFPYNSLHTQAVAYTMYFEPLKPVSEATRKVERPNRERLMLNVTNRRSRVGVSRRSRVGVNYVIPSFRISVDFPRFRLLGFRLIFRDSVF